MFGKKEVDWSIVYDIMENGDIPECHGPTCMRPCCTAKFIQTTNDKTHLYYTSFSPQEYLYQEEDLYPSIREIQISVQRQIPLYWKNDYLVNTSPYILVSDCQNDDGSCKLNDRKPFACSMYPFTLESAHPLKACPNIIEICKDKHIISRILEVRAYLGATDNGQWLKNAKRQLKQLKSSRSYSARGMY